MKTKTALPVMLTARVIFSLHQWLIVVIIARSGGAETLGLFGLALAIVTPVNGLFGMGLRQGVATDVSGAFPARSYWHLRLAGVAAALAVSSVICVGFFADTTGLLPVLLAVFAMKAADLGSELCYGFRQRDGRLTDIAVSQTVRAVLGVAVFAGAYLNGAGLVVAVFAWAGAWAVIFFALDWRFDTATKSLPRRMAPGRARHTVVELGLVQLPFGVAAGMVLAGLSAPRLVLANTATLETLGVFSALFMVFQAGSTLVNTVVQTWISPLANAFRSDDIKVARTVISTMFLVVSAPSILMFLVIWAKGAWILQVLYGADYMAYSGAFTLLALAWAMRFPALVLRSIFHAKRRFWAGLSLDSAGTGLTVSVCLIASFVSPSMELICAVLAAAWAVHLTLLSAAAWHTLNRSEKFAPEPAAHADI